MLSFESVKRMMGWCPQEMAACNHDTMLFSGNSLCTSSDTSDEGHQYLDMPVQMFDWRMFAVIFGSIGLFIIGIQRSNIYVILLSILLYASLFIFDRTKISVDGEMLRIRFPVLGEKKYPKSSIDKVELFENYAHKHRMRSLIAFALIIVISLSETSIAGVMLRTSILLWIYVVYGAFRISRYPEIIKISARGRNIILYPRNEHDLLILKNIAPEKLE